MRTAIMAILAAVAATTACGAPPPDAPSASITADPDSICLGDEFRTVIHLDGRDSSARLTLVPLPPDPDDPPLSFRWSLSGARHFVVDGALAEPELWVISEGDRPLHVELEVRESNGGIATTLETVTITPLARDGSCPLGEEL